MQKLNRKFGCEFEFSSPFDQVANVSNQIIEEIYGKNKLKIKKAYYRSKKNKIWHLKTDTSTECELVTPISNIDNLHKILKVIQLLGKKEIKTTNNDSIHVHISVPDVPKANIIIAWLEIESIILKRFKRHRRTNHYCARLTNKNKLNDNIASVYQKALIDSSDHHSIISFFYYNKRKTVEFRISHATFDTVFIEGWIKFCLYFLRYAKKLNIIEQMTKKLNETKNTDTIIKSLKIKNGKIESFLGTSNIIK